MKKVAAFLLASTSLTLASQNDQNPNVPPSTSSSSNAPSPVVLLQQTNSFSQKIALDFIEEASTDKNFLYLKKDYCMLQAMYRRLSTFAERYAKDSKIDKDNENIGRVHLWRAFLIGEGYAQDAKFDMNATLVKVQEFPQTLEANEKQILNVYILLNNIRSLSKSPQDLVVQFDALNPNNKNAERAFWALKIFRQMLETPKKIIIMEKEYKKLSKVVSDVFTKNDYGYSFKLQMAIILDALFSQRESSVYFEPYHAQAFKNFFDPFGGKIREILAKQDGVLPLFAQEIIAFRKHFDAKTLNIFQPQTNIGVNLKTASVSSDSLIALLSEKDEKRQAAVEANKKFNPKHQSPDNIHEDPDYDADNDFSSDDELIPVDGWSSSSSSSSESEDDAPIQRSKKKSGIKHRHDSDGEEDQFIEEDLESSDATESPDRRASKRQRIESKDKTQYKPRLKKTVRDRILQRLKAKNALKAIAPNVSLRDVPAPGSYRRGGSSSDYGYYQRLQGRLRLLIKGQSLPVPSLSEAPLPSSSAQSSTLPTSRVLAPIDLPKPSPITEVIDLTSPMSGLPPLDPDAPPLFLPLSEVSNVSSASSSSSSSSVGQSSLPPLDPDAPPLFLPLSEVSNVSSASSSSSSAEASLNFSSAVPSEDVSQTGPTIIFKWRGRDPQKIQLKPLDYTSEPSLKTSASVQNPKASASSSSSSSAMSQPKDWEMEFSNKVSSKINKKSLGKYYRPIAQFPVDEKLLERVQNWQRDEKFDNADKMKVLHVASICWKNAENAPLAQKTAYASLLLGLAVENIERIKNDKALPYWEKNLRGVLDFIVKNSQHFSPEALARIKSQAKKTVGLFEKGNIFQIALQQFLSSK